MPADSKHYILRFAKISLDKSQDLNNTLNMSETTEITQNPKFNRPDSIITDLNMVYLLETAKGKTQAQVAKEFGVTPSAVSLGIKRVRELTALKTKGEISDPLNNHRARLIKKLRKTERVYDHALKPGKPALDDKPYEPGWKTEFRRLDLAVKTGLALDKGLGVLVDRSEAPQVINYEDKRIQVVQKLQLADQFGAAVPEPVRAEIVDNSGETSGKENSQAVVLDDSPINVSRETTGVIEPKRSSNDGQTKE